MWADCCRKRPNGLQSTRSPTQRLVGKETQPSYFRTAGEAELGCLPRRPFFPGILRWHQPNLSRLLLLGSLNCLEGTIRFSSLSYWVGSRGFQSLVCCLNEQDETLNPHQTPSRHENLQHVSKVHLSRRARPIASVMALGNGTKGPLLMWRL